MKQIKMYVGHIKAELHDAEEYAREAAISEDSKTADVFSTLAKDELGHAHKLHDQAARVISEYRAKGNPVPEAMLAVWEWEHEQMIDHEARVISLLNISKN